jgi:hypothetical protein
MRQERARRSRRGDTPLESWCLLYTPALVPSGPRKPCRFLRNAFLVAWLTKRWHKPIRGQGSNTRRRLRRRSARARARVALLARRDVRAELSHLGRRSRLYRDCLNCLATRGGMLAEGHSGEAPAVPVACSCISRALRSPRFRRCRRVQRPCCASWARACSPDGWARRARAAPPARRSARGCA